MIIPFLMIGLAIFLLYAFARFAYEKFREREQIVRRWKNPRIRRWWVSNGILFLVAVPVLMVVRDSDLLGEGDEAWGTKTVVFLISLIGIRLAAEALIGERPDELRPAPKPFERLRKNLTAEGRHELQPERLRLGQSRSLWWLYLGLGALVLVAIISPQCAPAG